MTTTQHNYKTETINPNNKGLDIYLNPFVFQISEDKKCFYYSEIGVLVSGKFHADEEELNKKWRNKFVVDIQYDYRSGDDINKFGYVSNTGTYASTLFCDNLEDAINKTLDFLNSDFVNYRTFGGEKIKQKNIYSIREIAREQNLRHHAMFIDHVKKDSLYLNLIKKAGDEEKLNKYIAIEKNRDIANQKYISKLSNRFLNDFGFELKTIVYQFKASLYEFQKHIKLEECTDRKKYTIRKVFQYYKY